MLVRTGQERFSQILKLRKKTKLSKQHINTLPTFFQVLLGHYQGFLQLNLIILNSRSIVSSFVQFFCVRKKYTFFFPQFLKVSNVFYISQKVLGPLFFMKLGHVVRLIFFSKKEYLCILRKKFYFLPKFTDKIGFLYVLVNFTHSSLFFLSLRY